MINRNEISAIRTILPVGLGIAIGIAIGAVALANVPASKAQVEAAPKANAAILIPLSSQPGIRFARSNRDGERCFAVRSEKSSETICTH